jgi:hypothetical protein
LSGFFFVAVFARLLGVIHAVGLFSFGAKSPDCDFQKQNQKSEDLFYAKI